MLYHNFCGLDSNRSACDPEKTTSFKVGAKWQDLAEIFSGSVAVYDAEKNNMLTAEPNTGFSATLGKVESQDVKFQLTTDAVYQFPSYTLVNLAASAELSQQLSVRFDVNNLFDKTYFENSYHKLWTIPGAPLNYNVSVKYPF
ncbi:TonB-dependent receptor [Alteromonas sp. ZYF713]|nr:TonB-dependent receptor [Alteromonas sp. ZYF713]